MVLEILLNDGISLLIKEIIPVIIIVLTSSVIAKIITTIVSKFGKNSGLPENVTRLINKIVTYFIAFKSFQTLLQVSWLCLRSLFTGEMSLTSLEFREK